MPESIEARVVLIGLIGALGILVCYLLDRLSKK